MFIFVPSNLLKKRRPVLPSFSTSSAIVGLCLAFGPAFTITSSQAATVLNTRASVEDGETKPSIPADKGAIHDLVSKLYNQKHLPEPRTASEDKSGDNAAKNAAASSASARTMTEQDFSNSVWMLYSKTLSTPAQQEAQPPKDAGLVTPSFERSMPADQGLVEKPLVDQSVASLDRSFIELPQKTDGSMPPPSKEQVALASNTQGAMVSKSSLGLAREESASVPTMQAAMVSDRVAVSILKGIVGGDYLSVNVNGMVAPADVQSPVHLDEAVAFALKNNFEISAAEEKARGAYWDKMGAYSQYLPAVKVSVDFGPERSAPATINDPEGNRVLDSTHFRRDRNITVTQPLIDLSIIADIFAMRDKEAIADLNERDVREAVALDTANTYLTLLQARISVRLAEEYKNYLDSLALRVKARVEGGGAPAADLDRIQGRAAIAEGARIEALGEYQSQLAEFKRLTKILPPHLVIPNLLSPAIPENVQDALGMALKSNPSYMSSQKKIDLATSDRDKTLSGLLPKLLFQFSDAYAYNAGAAAQGNPIDGVYPTQKTQNVMLVAQWALNGGTNITGGLSGAAKEREMTFRKLDVRSRIEQGIISSYASIKTAHDRQTALQRTIEADERVVKGFEYQFVNGTRSLFDLLDSYERLYNARLNFVRIAVMRAKAVYHVHRQMGRVIPAIVELKGNK